MNQKISLLFALSLTLTGVASAQDSTKAPLTMDEKISNVEGKVDGLNESYLETMGTVNALSKIKVGGYLQGQWQLADSNTSAVGGFSGGGFPATSNQRILLRRARLKTTYDAGTSQYILEIEPLPKGVVLKDAEIVLKEPWLKTFTLDLGLQDRPFGFEIPYSSASMETMERSRGEQVVFNGEKDLGVTLGINPTEKMGMLSVLNLKGGLFTGTQGYNGGTGDEIDSTLDFIGRAGFKLPFNDLNMDFDGGVSYYAGKTLGVNDSLYQMSGTALVDSVGAFVKQKNKTVDRSVLGFDAQFYFSIPVVGDMIGGSSIRGEYWNGTTIGTLTSSVPYGLATTPMVERKFMSWYATYIQNFGSLFQTVVRYDVYDPNTDVKGSDIGVAANGKLGSADIMYSTLGLGLLYYYDSHVKLVAYYDMITNENASTGTFSGDIADNVFTLRAQVKF